MKVCQLAHSDRVHGGSTDPFELACAGGHQLGLVCKDAIVVPPEANVPVFDWSPGTSVEGEIARAL